MPLRFIECLTHVEMPFNPLETELTPKVGGGTSSVINTLLCSITSSKSGGMYLIRRMLFIILRSDSVKTQTGNLKANCKYREI